MPYILNGRWNAFYGFGKVGNIGAGMAVSACNYLCKVSAIVGYNKRKPVEFP